MILNIHGFDGSNRNTNFKILRNMYGDDYMILSPDINYRQLYYFDDIYAQIEDLINIAGSGDKLDLIVGNSLGGFFASILAEKYSTPFILTNPCLRPDISLKDVYTEFLDDIKNRNFIDYNLRKWSSNGYEHFSNSCTFYGDNDDVLDSSLAMSVAHKSHKIVLNGGHRLSDIWYCEMFKTAVNILANKKR